MTRGDVIRQLKKGCEKSIMRGKILWMVKEGIILCHQLEKEGEEWAVETLRENDSPPVSCPKKYLDMTTPISVEWRKQVEAYHSERMELKKKIRDLLKEGKKIQLRLKPKEGHKLNVDLLIVEEVGNTIIARSPEDHRLYKVPQYLIHEIISE